MGIPLPLGVSAAGTPGANDQANGVVSGGFTGVGASQPFGFYGPFNVMIWSAVGTALTTTSGTTAATVASGTGLAAGNAVNSVNVPPGTTVGAISGTNVTLALPTITMVADTHLSDLHLTRLASTAGLVGAAVTGPGIPAGTTVLSIFRAAVPSNGTAPAVLGIAVLSQQPTVAGAGTFTFALTGNSVTTGTDASASFTGSAMTNGGTVQLERTFDGGATWLLCNAGGAGTPAQYANTTPISLVVGEPERGVSYRLNCIAYTSGTINYRMSATGQAALSMAVSSAI